MMPKEVRVLWVKALRSGKYRQIKQALHDDKGWCCLGVLCDLAIKDGIIKRFPESNQVLPTSVRDWAGLTDRVGVYQKYSHSLAADNDNGKTFAEIADVIESEPKGLFVKGGL